MCVQVSRALSELHVQVREIVGRACEDTLAEHGFVPDPIEDPAEDMEGENSTESGLPYSEHNCIYVSRRRGEGTHSARHKREDDLYRAGSQETALPETHQVRVC